MKIQPGYLYHIKDEFFDIINKNNLMINHKNGHSRPTYFTIKEGDILWFIPLSTNISKYIPLVNKKVKLYGQCNTILIRKILGRNNAILIQNAFPTLEKYIDHIHLDKKGNPVKVIDSLCEEIYINFAKMMELKKKGKNFFFTNIDAIKEKMLDELKVVN